MGHDGMSINILMEKRSVGIDHSLSMGGRMLVGHYKAQAPEATRNHRRTRNGASCAEVNVALQTYETAIRTAPRLIDTPNSNKEARRPNCS